MTRIESQSVNLNDKPESVFSFLNNLNNHQYIMPKQVSDWNSTEIEAHLKIQGLDSLHLKRDVTQAYSYIKIVPASPAKVDLYLEWHIQDADAGSTVKVDIVADLNMFMKMVAVKPLQDLANYMATHLEAGMKHNN
jgi:carbon monoxide dehydrogenase subunit G